MFIMTDIVLIKNNICSCSEYVMKGRNVMHHAGDVIVCPQCDEYFYLDLLEYSRNRPFVVDFHPLIEISPA